MAAGAGPAGALCLLNYAGRPGELVFPPLAWQVTGYEVEAVYNLQLAGHRSLHSITPYQLYSLYSVGIGGMVLRLGVRCGSSGEQCRYRQNWFILTTYCTLLGFAFSSALPSLHQFVTSSTSPEDHDVSMYISMHARSQLYLHTCTIQL